MSFLTPLFLLLGLLAVPIILMYMLRLRRREMLVSSTFLWQKLLRDREANAPWQKLRRNLLLILQLLILASLVGALARPFIPVPALVSGNVVILLDGSASMQATDVKPNRFTAAQEAAQQMIATLNSTDQMTIILAGQKPLVLVAATNNKNQLTEAVQQAQAGEGEADWAGAIALAAGAAQGFKEARIALISDGGVADGLPAMPAQTVYIPIGNQSENLAITALATRQLNGVNQLFATVRNYGTTDQTALFSLRLDGALFDSRQVQINAGNFTNLSWDIPRANNLIQATLSQQTQDFFALDDTAWTINQGQTTTNVLLVGSGNLFLEQVYSILPGISAFKTNAETDLNSIDPYDLYVFDSVPLPNPLPEAEILVINPISTTTNLLEVTGIFSNTTAIRVANNPLLQFVEWSNIHIRQAQQVSAFWAEQLVEGEGGALLLVGERNHHRLAIFTFALQDSDLPLQVAFPILMANITNWLSPGQLFAGNANLQLGDTLSLTPAASTSSIRITKPDGQQWTGEVGERELVFSETDRLGVYELAVQDGTGEQAAGQFVVNLFSGRESNIMPASTLTLTSQIEESNSTANIGQRELWVWLAILAFLVLLGEWWVHHRGTRLPQLPIRSRK